jgi:hypothetical protein
MTKELHRLFLPQGYRVDWWASGNSPLGNETEARIASATVLRPGGPGKYEGKPLPERGGKDRKQNGYEQYNGQEQG